MLIKLVDSLVAQHSRHIIREILRDVAEPCEPSWNAMNMRDLILIERQSLQHGKGVLRGVIDKSNEIRFTVMKVRQTSTANGLLGA